MINQKSKDSIKKKLNRLHAIVSALPDDYVCTTRRNTTFDWNKKEILDMIEADLKYTDWINRFTLRRYNGIYEDVIGRTKTSNPYHKAI